MLRKLKQWIAGGEIAAFAVDLEKALDVNQTQAHRIEGLQLRLERLSNRVNMRLNRAGAPRDDDRDAEILEEIRRHSSNGGQRPAFEDGPDW